MWAVHATASAAYSSRILEHEWFVDPTKTWNGMYAVLYVYLR